MERSEWIHSSFEADKIYQPLLEYIAKKKRDQLTVPYIPKCPLLPPHKLSRLAILWKEAGFEKEAFELNEWVSSLAPFPTLWCSESDYKEAKELNFLNSVQFQTNSSNSFGINLNLLECGTVSAVLTLDGKGTSLGVIRSKSVEIRAFGPQSPSLQFGIQGRGLQGWTHTAAYPEVWLEMKGVALSDTIRLDLRFVGITLDTPLFFAFYVKAQSCEIGKEKLKPKGLRRYQGSGDALIFDNQLKIKLDHSCSIQVIPLAGEGCFWDADFLVLFPLNPFLSQVAFSFA